MVGAVMLEVLESRKFPLDELLVVASERSIGKKLRFGGDQIPVTGLQQALDTRPDIALFSAGAATSLEWAPRFAEVGTVVIDNSSAWRMDPGKKLIVPEVNLEALAGYTRRNIIANPNCSTIQMLVALKPIYDAVGIERINVATYQAVSGTGKEAIEELAVAGGALYGAAASDTKEAIATGNRTLHSILGFAPVDIEEGA